MKSAVIFALVGAAVASPKFAKRAPSIDPLSASLAVYNALPASLQAEALTNPAAVASEVSSEFLTGTPAWFSSLPTDVQSYFISVGGAGEAVQTAAPSTNATTTGGIFSNSTAHITSSRAASSTSESSASTITEASGSSDAAASSTSSGLGALPTVVAGGFAGVAGLMAILAL